MKQILIVLAQVVLILILAFLWTTRDTKAAKKQKYVEPFLILMSIFLLSAVFTFLLKIFLTVFMYYFYFPHVLSLFLEEFVKIVALIIGLEFAKSRFNEMSDGVVYTVFSALGFIFFENLIYMFPVASSFETFSALFFGRNLFSFAAHLFTVSFGVFYAFAYLFSKKKGKKSRLKPWQIVEHLKLLWAEKGLLFVLWLPFSPFITLYKFFTPKLMDLSIPELLWSGFLLSFYLHIGYDMLLNLKNPLINSVVLFLVGLFVFALYRYFPRLNVNVKI